jgi:hypothetical protein
LCYLGEATRLFQRRFYALVLCDQGGYVITMLVRHRVLGENGINEMDPPLCGTASMNQNEFKTSEPIETQETSP